MNVAIQDSKATKPIFVGLNHSLVRVNTLAESICGALMTRPGAIFQLLRALLRGMAPFKETLASIFTPDAASLPYNLGLLDYLREQKRAGRKIYLATSANQKLAREISEHLQLFDDVIASVGSENRSGAVKLSAMAVKAGSRDFCYVGGAAEGMPAWKTCGTAVVVDATSAVTKRVGAICHLERAFPAAGGGLASYLRAMRIHQWVKNLLLFVPVLPGLSQMTAARFGLVGIGFCAFCLCSSSFYIVNDLLDLPADRQHPSKRRRPFAAGDLSVKQGVLLATFLLIAGLMLAAFVSPWFLAMASLYLLVTAGYSFGGKRLVLVDVLILAGLYALRVGAGAVAAELHLSFWMLAFSMALFLSLAFVKRYGELQGLMKRGLEWPAGRGYRASDMPLVEMFGVGAGLASVLMLSLYLEQDAARMAFRHPLVLGALCPVLLYWIFRVWLHAHRGIMHDDPVVFAIRDRVSRYVLLLAAAIIAAADL